MNDQYVWITEFKLGKWNDFQGMQAASSLELAKRFWDSIHSGMTWFQTKNSGDRCWFARRRWPDGKYTTYRITRTSLITEEEVLMYERIAVVREAKSENRT